MCWLFSSITLSPQTGGDDNDAPRRAMAWQPPAGLAQCRCFLARCVSSSKHSCHFVQPTVIFYDKPALPNSTGRSQAWLPLQRRLFLGQQRYAPVQPMRGTPQHPAFFNSKRLTSLFGGKKKPRGCATGPDHGPSPHPLPPPVCDTPAFVTKR